MRKPDERERETCPFPFSSHGPLSSAPSLARTCADGLSLVYSTYLVHSTYIGGGFDNRDGDGDDCVWAEVVVVEKVEEDDSSRSWAAIIICPPSERGIM